MEGTPNIVAYLSLAVFPLFAFAVCALVRPAIACTVVILTAQMFLPHDVAFDAPVIPALDKDVIPPLSALIGCLIVRPRVFAGARIGRGYDLFLVVLVLGTIATTLTNKDPLPYGPVTLQGHTLYDAISDATKMILYWWIPFFLGRTVFNSERDLKTLFVALAVAGIVYSLFMFVEMRLSPQFNRWIYGFHQSEFQQTIREGGYRPKVFMRHGLNVALFMLVTLMATVSLARTRTSVLGLPGWVVAAYLGVVLVLAKSAGAIVFAIVVLPLLVLLRARRQAQIAAGLALVIFSYPLARAMGWVPVESIIQFFRSTFGEERAFSLAWRLNAEQDVLGRATERIAFGWGGYARPFIHSPTTGENLTVIDGYWAIVFGTRGLVGYLALFGLFLLPVWRLRKRLRELPTKHVRILAACLALVLVVYTADLIPNSSIDPYLTFLIGALVGVDRFEAAPLVAPLAQEDPPELAED